jgi:hypothetical protein
MAYGQKYSITYATKADKLVELKLWQEGYTGSIITLQGIDVSLQYIPNSDDPYEPILASQLDISIDFTDTVANIIDFSNIDDRYLYIEMYINNVINWVGFLINDNVQISYSTGRKIASFNATDGLGMLKDIPFVPHIGNYGVNGSNTLLTILLLCFNSLDFKNNRNLITMCSYYSLGMADRGDATWRDPFAQAFMNYRNFLQDEYNYTNCLDVISNIAKSFGCRVFQAKGKWWIVAINEFAETNAYYTEYLYTGIRVVTLDGNQINTSSLIEYYCNNTSDLYFINNSQVKIINKGFYKIIAEGSVEMAQNYLPNGDLRDNDGTEATFWTRGSTGDATCTLQYNTTYDYYYFELTTTPGGPAGTASVQLEATSQPNVTAGDSLNLNILIGATTTDQPIGFIDITIFNGTTTYYLNSQSKWQTTSTSYIVYNPKTSGDAEDFNLDLKTEAFPLLATGTLSFKYRVSEGVSTFNTLTNFVMKIKSKIANYKLSGSILDTDQYVHKIDFPYGVGGYDSYYPSAKGAFLLSDNSIATQWYRYGLFETDLFLSLPELLIQQYVNTYGQNIINVDCDLTSFYTANATYPIFDASKLLFSEDNDPAVINISNKSYMLSNSTINYPSNQINATLLQISNDEIECTRVNKYTLQKTTF